MLFEIIPQEETEITEVVSILRDHSPLPPVEPLYPSFSEFLLSVHNSQNIFLESDF
jgi:hypothetical protein